MTLGDTAVTESIEDTPRDVRPTPGLADRAYRRIAGAAGMVSFGLMALVAGFLLVQGSSAFRTMGWRFFTTTEWSPDAEEPVFGVAALLYGTFVVSLIAVAIAVPVSIATALYIVEYSPRSMRRTLTALVDMLAAIPSLIFGIWGLLYLTPKLFGLGVWLDSWIGPWSWCRSTRSGAATRAPCSSRGSSWPSWPRPSSPR